MNDDKTLHAGESKEPGRVQGEGDYEAARRFNKAAAEFEKSHDVDKLAHDAAPQSPAEAQEMREAEEQGRRHSKGEDEQDIFQTEGD